MLVSVWPQRLLTHSLPVYSSSSLCHFVAYLALRYKSGKKSTALVSGESVISLRLLQRDATQTKSFKLGTSKGGSIKAAILSKQWEHV